MLKSRTIVAQKQAEKQDKENKEATQVIVSSDAQKQAEKFAADGLKFAGGIMNKQMILTVQALHGNMSSALRQCLVQLETF